MTTTTVDPSEFFQSFQSYVNAFDLGDATRALNALLKCARTILKDTTDDSNDILQKARQDFQALYEFLLVGSIELRICGRKSKGGMVRTKQKNGPLLIPFPIDGSKSSVQEALQAALEPALVNGYNWEEEEVESATGEAWQTTKQTVLQSLPIFLLLQLKRFEYSSENGRVQASSNQQPIKIEASLSIESNGVPYHYDLIGGILHTDDVDAEQEEDYEGGHYTTLLRDDNWHHVDGIQVTQVSQQQALDALSGKPGVLSNGPSRGTLLVYSRPTEQVEGYLDRFRQSLSLGHSLFPPVEKDSPHYWVGKRLRIRWSSNKYYAGKVTSYNETSGKHKVEYDDGDVRDYKLHKKVVEWDDPEVNEEWKNNS